MNTATKTLGEVCDQVGGVIRTGPFGTQLHESDYRDEGTPVVMPKNIVEGTISLNGIAFVDEETANRLAQHKLRVGDIVYGRRGDIGRRALIHEGQSGWLCGTGCLRISLGDSVLEPRFLYYYLGEPQITQWIANRAIGATLPNLNTSIIRSVSITYPSLESQNRVASILSVYDDLIENNIRRTKILEEMAGLIYDEWFVKFRFPGHGKARITDSDGLIGPREWERTSVAHACVSVDDGDWIETKDQGGDDYRLLQISNVGVNSFVETDNYRFITEETFRRLRCKEVLPDHILVARMPTPIGRAWLVTPQPWKMITAVDVAILEADRSRAHAIFLLHFLNSEQTLAAFAGKESGTTRPRITRKQIASTPILLPPLELQARFARVAEPINELVAVLHRASLNLRSTRDLLLPKLISGEIDVEKLDIPTEAATADFAAATL